MKKIFILIVFLQSAFLFAQEIQVIDKTSLQPVSNCTIFNEDQNFLTTTDNQGKADISGFTGKGELTFSHLSFNTLKLEKADIQAVNLTVKLTRAIFNLKEVVFSANKIEERYTDLANRIDIISVRQIQLGNPQTSGDLLQQSGKVFVQTSQQGGGSPVIRGMESSRVLLAVDGIRMNNAIYRAGHLQNVITIDPNILQRVEVVHGPGSVIYGSDALGGVMHFYTRNPVLSSSAKVTTSGNLMMRYASAAQEYSQSFLLNVGGKKIAVLVGGSTKDIGDLRQGSNRDSKYGDWGKCLYYAERIDGKDVMTKNDDPLIQKNSGYKQYDIFMKVLWKTSENHNLLLNAQYSNSSDVPRYDRLTEYSGEKLKYAEWYYGPQTRGMVSLCSSWSKSRLLFDNARLTVAYQYISEDRVSRSFGKSKKKHQEETVNIMSLNADLMKSIFKNSELRYGIEANVNSVDSKAYNENISTGAITNDVATRYPDDGNKMTSLAAYASNNWEISEKFIFSQGIRFSHVSLDTEYTNEMMEILKFPFEPAMSQDNTALNGSLGIVYFPEKSFRIAANLSSGFRAPNIDDLSKINDSNSTGQLIIVPNPELKPEYAYNAELTVSKTIAEKVQIELTGFYTWLNDAFVARPFLYNGQDSIVFDDNLCAVQALQNAEKANIYGFEGNFTAQLHKNLSLFSSLTYTHGEVKDDNTPLDHIPPLFGITTLKYEREKFSAEFYVRYNSIKKIEDYSDSGEDNQAYATEDGMPGWYTLNLKAGYQFNRYVSLQAGVENILDQHYRLFASGISAPGRNIFVTLRGTL